MTFPPELFPTLSAVISGLSGLAALRLVWISHKVKQEVALDLGEDED